MSDYSTAPHFNILTFAIHCIYCTPQLEMYLYVIKSVLKFIVLAKNEQNSAHVGSTFDQN